MNSIRENVDIIPITHDDTDLIVKWRNSDHVRKKFIYRKEFTRETHEEWMKNHIETGKTAQFIINVNGNKIGSVFLRDIDKKNKKAEFGIFIGEKEYWNQGYGVESTRQILEYGFEQLGLNKVFLRVLAFNNRAIKSYVLAGFKHEGVARQDVCIDGIWHDVIFMSILRKEWENEQTEMQ